MEKNNQEKARVVRQVKPIPAATPRRERVAAYCRVSSGKDAIGQNQSERNAGTNDSGYRTALLTTACCAACKEAGCRICPSQYGRRGATDVL